MRDDLHKTAVCPPVWQELFRVGLNEADRAKPERLIDAAIKALRRDLNVELSNAVKSLLRRLVDQPSLLHARDLIGAYEPQTPLEVAVRAEFHAAAGEHEFEAALQRALTRHIEAYLREFDCRMVEGRVYDRAEVERALRDALNDQTVRDACEGFLSKAKVEAKAEDLSLEEVLAPAPAPNKDQGR